MRSNSRARVLDFVGAPDEQMRAAAELAGCCFICGKMLTDPISLERGIGPDCYADRTKAVEIWAAAGHDVATIAFRSGMPRKFVEEIMREIGR